MNESNEAPIRQHPTKDRIAQLKADITDRMPSARRSLTRSGIDTESNNPQIKRAIINTAGELLKKDLELGYDLLTGLPLRDHYLRLKAKFIKETAAQNLPMTIVNIDLDELKITNDVWGHAAGNKRIKETAIAAKEMLREGDLLGRLGGDEFEGIVIVTPEEATQLKKRMDEGFKKKDIRASVGIAVVNPQDVDASTKAADRHMYAEKRRTQREARLAEELEKLTHNG